jgi:LmbE family N-acetylglucosaminyl deacetylase
MAHSDLTLLVVHAHPDDEATSTGGVLHKYSAEGVRTVLVTCTGGELGDGPGGVKPGESGHDEATVRDMRRLELEALRATLGVADLEMLGYLDSGMAGWPQNGRSGSLSGTDLEEELARLIPIFERFRPQVVISYDQTGGYGHPDHVRAHELAVAATDRTGIPAKLYYTAFPKSIFKRGLAAAREAGISSEQLPSLDFDLDDPPFGVDDSLITTRIDVASDVPAKLAALRAHASQADNGFWLTLPAPIVTSFMSTEYFIRAVDSTGSPVPESDLFAGIR